MAPASFASCTANTPTPPAAPPIRTVSPDRRPIAARAAAAVMPATGSVPATSSLMPSGVWKSASGASAGSLTTTKSAAALPIAPP